MIPIVLQATVPLTDSIQVAQSEPRKFGQVPIVCGWHDELDRPSDWKHLAVANKPNLNWSKPGLLGLSLNRVPFDWPYQYQWSGVTKLAEVDIAAAPYLTARITELRGYAHMDIDVIDHEKVIMQLRSTTLQSQGVTSFNLGERLFPATYTLRLRLIVGGPNEGCSATFDWIRFTSNQDGKRLIEDPGLPLLQENSNR